MGNTIVLIGRLGQDPELRYTPSGTPVCNFSLASDVGWGDNKKTVWFRINCWNKTTEIANQYLAKGNRVHIVGEFSDRQYTTNNGESRTSLEIRCNNLEFIETSGSNQGGDYGPAESQTPAENQADAENSAEDVEELPW